MHGLIKSKATPLSVTKPNYLSASSWVSLCHNLSDILSHRIARTLSDSVSCSLWHSLSHIITYKSWHILWHNISRFLSDILSLFLWHILFDMLSLILSHILWHMLFDMLWHSAMAFRTLLSIPHCNICARDCQGKNQGIWPFTQLLHCPTENR